MNKNSFKKDIFHIYKPIGISPLDAIKALKNKHPELRGEKMTYTGRLDPMAEGVVLIVKGEELKNFHDHLKYDKEYKAKIIFGFETDSYDILGLSKRNDFDYLKAKDIEETIKSFEGDYTFQLPPFSGYNIKGKPLFKWALEERLDEIEIPEKTVEVKEINIKKIGKIRTNKLKKEIVNKIGRVTGDFRQEKILSSWNNIFKKVEKIKFPIVELSIKAESGFYVRSLAHDAGKKLKSGGVLFHLTRTKVGEWSIEDSIKI